MSLQPGDDAVACGACGSANPAGASFCGQCGGSLSAEIRCETCGATAPAGQKFCNDCGASLTAEDPASAAPPAPSEPLPAEEPEDPAALSGERKQVTVLFADVTGSMDLAERIDPERWQEIMDGFFALLAAAVNRLEGTVDKFTGDGIMALFGAPRARRTMLSGRVTQRLRSGRRSRPTPTSCGARDGISFTTRVGINSGEVVVGSIGEEGLEYTAIGHTVGLAQRMEALAEPGSAYLTGRTAALATGFLELRELGEFDIKGSSVPVPVFELMGIGTAKGRLDVSQGRGFTPFVGRGEESEQLRRALEQAFAGSGEVVGIVADAGVGKSRLCREFADRCRAEGLEVVEAQCQPHGKAIPLMPVLQMLRAYFGIEPDTGEREARERIAGRLLLLDPGFADDLGLVFDFLAVPDPERPGPVLNPEARQRRLLGLIQRLVQLRGRENTVVNLVEDLHWIDPASEEFLAALIEAAPGTRTIVVTNFRPEYRAEWMSHSYYRQIPLTPLGPEALDELLTGLLGTHSSLDGLSEMICEKTQGNPFFVEEVVRELAESGTLAGEPGSYRLVSEIDDIAVPPTVHAVLAARIDRLGAEAKHVLQAAAAIGKDFRRDLLIPAADRPEARVDEALAELRDAEFILQTALYPEPEYTFRHPLAQEVAHQSQLTADRAATHARIAEGLQQTAPERLDEQAAAIARHYEEGRKGLEAAQWHARAAGWAGLSNPESAREHWMRVRALDDQLPDGDEGDMLRTTARVMALVIGWRTGADLEETRDIHRECIALGERRGDPATLAIACGTLGVAEGTCGGDAQRWIELAEQGRPYVGQIEDPGARAAALTAFMYPLFLAGRYEESLQSVNDLLEITRGDLELGAGIVVASPHAWATAFRSPSLMLLGRLEEAAEALAEGMRLCETADRESLGWAHSFQVSLARCGLIDYGPETVAHGLRSAEIADELGDGFSRVIAYAWLGLAQLKGGQVEAAAEALDTALQTVKGRGVGLESEPFTRALRARARAVLGEPEEALEEGRVAVALCDERGTQIFAPLVRVELALSLIERGRGEDLDEAGRLLDQAASGARSYRMLPDLVEALSTTAKLREALGDTSGARAAREEGLEISNEIGAAAFVSRLEAEGAVAA